MNQNLPLIKKIDISECHLITDSGIASLVIAKSDKLTELYMTGCSKITDLSLKLLHTCHTLRKLDIRDCHSITDEGCERFLDPNHHYDDDEHQDNKINGHLMNGNNHHRYSDPDSDDCDSDNENNDHRQQIRKRIRSISQNNNDGFCWQLLKERLFIKCHIDINTTTKAE